LSTLTTYDGLSLSYTESGEDTRRPPVVLLHGYAADSYMNWVAPGIAGALVLGGHRVIALDARGHGQSDAPHEASFYGEATMAQDVSLLADLLSTEQFDLVGYAWGAVIALLVAGHDPRVRRLVVGGIGTEVADASAVGRRKLRDRQLAEALRLDDEGAIADVGLRSVRRFAEQAKADRLALAAHAEGEHAPPISLDGIGVETLVVAGEDDEYVGSPAGLAAVIGASVALVPGDHLGAVFSKEFKSAVVKFLE